MLKEAMMLRGWQYKEQQYEYPWDNEEEVECWEVELKEVMVKKWVNVQ